MFGGTCCVGDASAVTSAVAGEGSGYTRVCLHAQSPFLSAIPKHYWPVTITGPGANDLCNYCLH